MTHDYKRHGTTHAVAVAQRPGRLGHRPLACNATAIRSSTPLPQPGRSQGPGRQDHPRHRRQLRHHKHPKVRAWLARHPPMDPSTSRLASAIGSTPSRASSPNCTKRRLKRARVPIDRRSPGRHQPLPAETNSDPRPFTWTADPDKIIAAVRRRAPSVKIRSTSSRKSGRCAC